MDPEINAMTKMAEALQDLDDAERSRVLRWAADKFEVALGPKAKPQTEVPEEQQGSAPDASSEGVGDEQEYETFAELFSDACPSTTAEKVLVAGYWHQEMLGQSDITSAALNKDLKDLGHAITGMNDRFSTLMSAKPQLAIQLKKSGSSKQARKKYKITKAGISKVQEMLGE